MGLMDRIKKVTGTSDNYDTNIEDDYYRNFGDSDADFDNGVDMPENDLQFGTAQYQPSGMSTSRTSTIGGSQIGNGLSLSGANIKMQVVRPTKYDSDTASQIANHLLAKNTVVLNLEGTSKETTRRLIDFLSGVAYSIGGSLKKIATNAYVITPSNVDVGEAQIKQQSAAEEEEVVEEAPLSETGDFSDFN